MAKRRALRELPKYDPDNHISTVDRVRFAMINNRLDALHVDELTQFHRWKQIDDLMREKRWVDPDDPENIQALSGRRQIRNFIMAKFQITWDTAERDIRNAVSLFTPAQEDKEYYRSVYLEDLETVAEEARAAGKYDAYAKMKALAAELRELNKPTVEEITDKFQAFQFIIQYNPEAIGLKTIENKDEVLERWRKRKAVSDRMREDADDAIII